MNSHSYKRTAFNTTRLLHPIRLAYANHHASQNGGAYMFLELNNITKHFGEGESRVEVLRGIDLGIEKGEITVLLGPTGSGKSTLLNIIGGIDSADTGYIAINGEKTADMN